MLGGNLLDKNEILEFYKRTSLYTDLGLYKDFAKNLPNDIAKFCILQRNQIIHPFDLFDEEMRKDKNSCYGDMTKVPKTALCYETFTNSIRFYVMENTVYGIVFQNSI